MTLVELGRPILRAPAQLRAVHGTPTPDALQLAAALSGRCRAFVTNHQRVPSLPNLAVLRLRDFV